MMTLLSPSKKSWPLALLLVLLVGSFSLNFQFMRSTSKQLSETRKITTRDAPHVNLRTGHYESATSAAINPCLSLEETDKSQNSTTPMDGDHLETMIAQAKQIYITMPAKAAGSSLKGFTKKCMKRDMPDNFLNKKGPHSTRDVFTSGLDVPPIIASHVYSDYAMVDLLKHSVRKSLLIYIHRDETERLISAIKYMIRESACKKNWWPKEVTKSFKAESGELDVAMNGTDCTLNESALVNLIEQQSIGNEINFGQKRILTCDMYDAIQNNAPDMVFVHYTKANQLQDLLAKYHCPELMSKPTESNTEHAQTMQIHVKLAKGDDTVNIESWMDEKAPSMEYMLGLREGMTCQGKTKHMEDKLFACPHETIKVSDVRNW